MSGEAFSVALATYNGERFLPVQLASLAAQTLLPTELVVYDDVSSDRTIGVLEEFAADAPFPVRVNVNSPRLGFADTFLRCAADCRGDWVAFCDQDDLWLESKLERCAVELTRGDVALVMHTSRVADAELQATRHFYPHIRRNHLEPPLSGDPWLAVRGMSMAFASELLRVADPARRPRSHYTEGSMHHDEWVYVLARALGTISYVAEPLALYRQHEFNVTGADDGRPDVFNVGATYYGRRREQALVLADILDELGDLHADRHSRAAAAAEWYRRQAQALERRVSVYDPHAPTRERFGRLVKLAGSGTYGRRKRGGFGIRGFARDAAMIALRRTG